MNNPTARPLKAPNLAPAAVGFLRTELLMGMTLSRIAREAGPKSKTERNRANARKAYEAVLHFLPKVPLTSDEVEEIKGKLAKLKTQLRRLGEDV